MNKLQISANAGECSPVSREGSLVGSPAKPVLRDGTLYISDNGRLICSKCAGASALYTGRDISGQKVAALHAEDAREWKALTGKDMACERGCTSFNDVEAGAL